jgi:HK97 family phage major capsid protein
MEANNKVKALLDELASVLAEMGALGEVDEAPEGDEMESNSAEGKKHGYEDSPEDEAADASAEESADEEIETQKEKKLRCLCERAEKLRERIKFYEGVAAKELELRAVLDKSTPASESAILNPAKEGRSVSIYHNLPGAGRLRAFKGPNAEERAYRAGQFYRATLLGDKNAARWCADHGVVTESRAQGETVNSLGGIFVNDEVLNEIIVLVEQYGAFASAARNVNMQSDTLIIPRRVGGLSAYFVGENTAVTDSDASWDRVQLVAKKVAVSNRMSSEILEDSVLNLADYLTSEVARAIAQLTDRVGFVGNGSGADGGIIGACTKIVDGTHNASVVTAGTGAVSAETLTIADLVATAGRLPLYSRANAQWYVSPAVYSATVQRLGLSSNVGTLAGGNTQDTLTSAPELRLLGYKVNFVHTMNSTLGSDPGAVKFLLGDMKLSSMYATRRSLQLRTSVDRYAELDQTLLVASTRFDAVTHDCGSNTVAGPLVALKTAAS